MKYQPRHFEAWMLMSFFALLGAMFLFLIGNDALNDRHPFAFFADSITYHLTYKGEVGDGRLIGVDSNYVGPLLVLTMLGGNTYLVMLLNVTLFTWSVSRVSRLLHLDPVKVILLLMLSPLTASSLLSVNKEIFLYPFLAFALSGHVNRSATAMVLAIVCSILVRWQLAGLYALLMGLSISPRLMKSRWSVVLTLLLVLSGIYLLIQPLIAPVLAYVRHSIENYDAGGSGLFEQFLDLQDKGFYFLVFPAKSMHLLFGMGLKLGNILSPTEIYNDLFVSGHCLAAFLTFLTLLFKRRFTISSDLVFVSLLFLAFFCLTPVFAPRYLYFVFVLWVLVLAGARATLPRKAKTRRRPLQPEIPTTVISTDKYVESDPTTPALSNFKTP